MSANNTLILIGRLTADPTIRQVQGEKPFSIANFTLAVDRGDKNKTTDFINCKAMGNRAEFIEKYIKKGTKIILKGYWETGNYTNKDGQKVYTNTAMAEDVSFAESKGSNSSNTGSDLPTSSLVDELPVMSQPKPVQQSMDWMNIPEGADDLPFALPNR